MKSWVLSISLSRKWSMRWESKENLSGEIFMGLLWGWVGQPLTRWMTFPKQPQLGKEGSSCMWVLMTQRTQRWRWLLWILSSSRRPRRWERLNFMSSRWWRRSDLEYAFPEKINTMWEFKLMISSLNLTTQKSQSLTTAGGVSASISRLSRLPTRAWKS